MAYEATALTAELRRQTFSCCILRSLLGLLLLLPFTLTPPVNKKKRLIRCERIARVPEVCELGNKSANPNLILPRRSNPSSGPIYRLLNAAGTAQKAILLFGSNCGFAMRTGDGENRQAVRRRWIGPLDGVARLHGQSRMSFGSSDTHLNLGVIVFTAYLVVTSTPPTSFGSRVVNRSKSRKK